MVILIWVLLLGAGLACGPDCLACNSLYCLACGPGTELSTAGECTSSRLLFHCAILLSASLCSQCQPTFALSAASLCEKDYSGCLETDPFTGECTLCRFGKQLSKGKCLGVLNCQQYQNGSCSKCESEFELRGQLCFFTGQGCTSVHQ
jgi:hypothetical protein